MALSPSLSTPESVAADLELDFRPPRGLRSPHVQAVVGTSALRRWQIERQTAALRDATRSEILHCPDGIRLEGVEVPAAGLRELARPPALTVAVTRHGGHYGFLGDYRLASWLDGEVEQRLLPLLG